MMDVNRKFGAFRPFWIQSFRTLSITVFCFALGAAGSALSAEAKRGLASYGFSEGFAESLWQAGKMNPLARHTASVPTERSAGMGLNYSLLTPEERIRFIENQQPRPLRKYVNPYSPTSMNNPFGEGNPYRVDGPSNLFGTGLPFYRLSIGK